VQREVHREIGWLIREDRQTNGTSAVRFPIHADRIQPLVTFLTVSLFNAATTHHPGEPFQPVGCALSQNQGL